MMNNNQGAQNQEGLYQVHAKQVKIKEDPTHGTEVVESQTYHGQLKQKQPTGQPPEINQNQQSQSLGDKNLNQDKYISYDKNLSNDKDKQFQSSELSKKGIQTPSHEASHRLSSQEKHGEQMQKSGFQDKSYHGVQSQTKPQEKSYEKQPYVTQPHEKVPPLQKQENVNVLQRQEKEHHLPTQNKETRYYVSQEKKVPLPQKQEKSQEQLYGRQIPEKQPLESQKLSHEQIGHGKLSQEKLGYEKDVGHGKLDQQKLSPEKFTSEKRVIEKSHEIQPQSYSQQPQSYSQQPQQQQQQPQQQQPQTKGLVFTQVYQAQLAPQTNMPVQANILQGTQFPGSQLLQGMNSQNMGTSDLSASNTWTQPLPDAKGTIIGKANFSREIAREDAITLFRAMNGAGTNKAAIIDITAKRTFAQRQMIKKEYMQIDNKGQRDLLQDFKSELGGDLERIILPLYMMPGEFDARLMEKAMYGIKNDVDLLIEVLCTRTNKEIEDMKRAWTEKIDSKQRLEERVRDETKKLLGLTNFHVLCLKILEGRRPPCQKPDMKQARVDAEELNHQLLNRTDINDAKAKFVEIFTERSWAHIAAVVGEFQKISQKYTMDSAIAHEFGESSNTTKALRVIAEFCFQPYDFWAKRLRDAMKGLGTDDSTLIRIIVTRCEVDLYNVEQVFGHRYGEGKNLKSWIESDTSGDYCQLLLNLCGYY